MLRNVGISRIILSKSRYYSPIMDIVRVLVLGTILISALAEPYPTSLQRQPIETNTSVRQSEMDANSTPVPGRRGVVETSVGGRSRRQRRNVFQLCRVIRKYTSNSCFDYNNYGCFCGLRSRGSHPVDDVDRCCLEHDHCFTSLRCTLLSFTTYSMKCSGSKCTCTTDSKTTSCRYRSCQCDIKFGECLQAARYNKRHKNFNTLRCH
ncbi:phospholipase A2-like isoform X3 [Biomphalaria glabrata]|uniref:phospholipase A2 n=1 Tax=Biomphalaria glabrata TaxID=6526 RepID=A0A9W3AWP6_BIOGL|nr:phospholipase A2-like isoform X3 [Biomphalaria glabrata]